MTDEHNKAVERTTPITLGDLSTLLNQLGAARQRIAELEEIVRAWVSFTEALLAAQSPAPLDAAMCIAEQAAARAARADEDGAE